LKIKEPSYLFPITGGIITILGLILPLGYYWRFDGTGNKSLGSFFWIIFHNIKINDLYFNLLINLEIFLLSILIVGCTALTFKIVNDAKKKKIKKKKFETKMFVLAIMLSLLGINLILIVGNAYLREIFDHFTYYFFLPSSMWGYYFPNFGFFSLIFGPIIIRFGTFYNSVDTEEKKKDLLIKTFIVLNLLLVFIWFSFLSIGLDIFLVYLTISIILDSGIYLFLKKEPHLAEVSQPDIIIEENSKKNH